MGWSGSALFQPRGPRLFLSGVGNAYAPPPVHDPCGKISIFGSAFSPEAHARGSLVRTAVDGRLHGAREIEAAGPRSWS